MASLAPKFISRTKVLKGGTSELKMAVASIKETVYKKDNKEFTFLAIAEPNEQVLENINKNYNFHHLAIEDCLSEFQRSKLEQYDDYIHVILQFPYYNDNSIVPAEVNFFVSDSYLVLVHWNTLPYLNLFIKSIIEDKDFKKECMEKGTGYLLYKILDLLVLKCFPLIDKLEKRVRNLENRIFDEKSYDDRITVREIAKTRRDIMVFNRIIKPQIGVMNTLERIKEKYLHQEELDLYFGDLADYVTKQWEMIVDQNEMVINLNSTNESLISVRANSIIKTLTIISVIMLPLTLISGIYGMNIRLPLAAYKYSFEVIIVFMLATATLMISIFKSKKWI